MMSLTIPTSIVPSKTIGKTISLRLIVPPAQISVNLKGSPKTDISIIITGKFENELIFREGIKLTFLGAQLKQYPFSQTEMIQLSVLRVFRKRVIFWTPANGA